jgi:hypothetical protein
LSYPTTRAGVVIVALKGQLNHGFVCKPESGVSSFRWTPWEYTRHIAVRDHVRKAAGEADGRVRANSANNYPLHHQLGPESPETPWYIHLADLAGLFRLLCFDFDGKTAGRVDPDLMAEAADQCDSLSQLLDELAIAHLVCESSATGGRHLWIALLDGATVSVTSMLADQAAANYPRLDHGMLRNASTGGARPPLSPHRDGSSSRALRGSLDTLLVPSTTTAQLQRLTQALAERRPASRPELTVPTGAPVASHRPHRELSRWGQAHMATANGGSNPSWTGFMCLLAAASAGWSLPDVKQAAQTAPGMEHYRTRNAGDGRRRRRSTSEAHARLERQWAKALNISAVQRPLPAYRPDQDLTELRSIVADVQAMLTSFRVSPGRWGAQLGRVSERSVLTSVAYLTLQTGKRAVGASVRDLALMAAVSSSTAAAALRRLQAAGAVVAAVGSNGGNATEWRLSLDFSTASDLTRTQPPDNTAPPSGLFAERRSLIAMLEEQLTAARHDLFTYQGLGHFAGKLYAHLAESTGAHVDDLRRALGMQTRHVITALSRLRSVRLVVRRPGGWARSRTDLRDKGAKILGVAGILERRRHRFVVDREVWAWWQAEYATMTSSPRVRPRRPHVTSRPLFSAEKSLGERVWPRYPRRSDGQADHREARWHVEAGHLAPTSRIQLTDAA